MRYLLRKPIHMSWQIAAASVMVVVGVWTSAAVGGWFVSVAWLLTGMALCLSAYWYQRLAWIVAAVFGGLFIGLWRGSIEYTALGNYQYVTGQTIDVSGVVSEDVDTDKQGNLILRLKDIVVADRQMNGSVWVTISSDSKVIQRSDRVTVNAKINEGFGTYPIALYRANVVRIERPEPGDVALKVRDQFAESVREHVPDPEASLGIGYLVGQRRALPPELDEALRIAGLTHIVVASGYNLTILVRMMRRLFEKVSKYLSMITSAGLIVSFIAVTGMSPSMSRAGLVAGLALAAWYYGRRFHPLVLLPFAAGVTVLINPNYAWGDIGWQLSFAAFAGVMVMAPLMQRYFFGDTKPSMIRQILGETIAATICTLPILLYTFGALSNVAVVANLLVLPLVPLAMLLTFVAGLSTITIAPLAAIISLPATWLLNYMTSVAMALADVPWAQTELETTASQAVLLALVIIGVCVYMWRVTSLNLRDSSIVE